MADISKITASNGTTYDIKDQTARDSISQLASGLSVEYRGIIAVDQMVTIANTSAQDFFIVAAGTWNRNALYVVFPNNGNAPIVRTVASYLDSPVTLVNFAANSNWGLTITGAVSPSTQLTVFKVKKS